MLKQVNFIREVVYITLIFSLISLRRYFQVTSIYVQTHLNMLGVVNY